MKGGRVKIGESRLGHIPVQPVKSGLGQVQGSKNVLSGRVERRAKARIQSTRAERVAKKHRG